MDIHCVTLSKPHYYTSNTYKRYADCFYLNFYTVMTILKYHHY